MSKKIKDLSDCILLEKFREGDASAYNILFKRYYDSLCRFALNKVKDSCIAEELTMDVMLGLWKKKGEINITDDLRPYLFRSIRNALYNHYRKNILSTVPLEQLTEEHHLIARRADYELEHQELERIYREKLNQLSPQRRKVYEMSREANMSYAEIAKEMDLSVNTVENYMVASLSFFRKELSEHADYTLVLPFIFLFL